MQTIETVFSKEIQALVTEIEENVVLNFTLSDAMRLGSSVTDQAHQTFFEEGAACALSAAVIGAKSWSNAS